jgi:hypothetical protein
MITRFSDFDHKNEGTKKKEAPQVLENLAETKEQAVENVVEPIKESLLGDMIYPEAKKPFLVPDQPRKKDLSDFIDPAFMRAKPEPEIEEPREVVREIELEPIQEEPQIPMDPLAYKIFRDKAESFECRVMIEGSNVQNTSVRLLLESEEWNIFFKGSISNGVCRIPLKKINILSPGLIGVIKLEVVVDGEIFYPWYETFQVQSSKNVKVEILSQKQNNQVQSGTSVRIA